jgi:Uncharacterized protein conserved in bacteria (DUF2125)
MIRSLSCTTALALVLSAPVALADVTPEEVWQSWQGLATAAGQDLTFDDATQTGDSLVVTGLVLTYTDTLGGSFSASMDRLTFTDNGDGTVSVTMADSYPMTLAFPDDGEGPTALKLTVTQPGTVVTAGGSATETSYAVVAPLVSITLDEGTGPGGQPLETEAELELTDMTASYVVQTEGEATTLDSNFAAKGMALSLSGKGLDGGGEGTVTLSLADLAGSTKGNFLGAEIMENMAVALNAGFMTQSSLSFGAMALNADIAEATGPVKLAGSLTGGSFDLAIDKEKMAYSTAVTGGDFTASGPEIPFPEVAVSFAESAVSFLMPVSKSDQPQEFSMVTKLVDLTVSEDIWGLVDPAAVLSRGPASFVLDVTGTGYWDQDIMDPAVQKDGAQPPGKLISLNLREVLAKAVGVEVGATGALTFDNNDLVTFEGVPAPSGSVNITIKGANGLIDNLITMGLIPAEEALMPRMMLGLFARPGAAADELTSVIEFKDGGLFANGQKLK